MVAPALVLEKPLGLAPENWKGPAGYLCGPRRGFHGSPEVSRGPGVVRRQLGNRWMELGTLLALRSEGVEPLGEPPEVAPPWAGWMELGLDVPPECRLGRA